MIVHATETWKILPVFETKLSLLPIHANTYLMYTILYFLFCAKVQGFNIANMKYGVKPFYEAWEGFCHPNCKTIVLSAFSLSGLFIYLPFSEESYMGA